MPADEPSGARPGPVVLRIKLRYDDVETMVQRFAVNVGRSGLFLPTKSIQPLGTEIKFELRIADDTPVLVGLGRVKSSRAPDPANPRAAFGMAIELMRVTREGREVIIRMIERRRVLALPDVAIPMPEDIDAAKRADVETQPRVDTGAIAITSRPSADSGPILARQPLETGPVAVVKPEPARSRSPSQAPEPARARSPSKSPDAMRSIDGPSFITKPDRDSGPIAGEQLLTAPRPPTGPIAVARVERSSGTIRAPALAPEPVRAKRPRLADVIAKAEASGPLGSAFPNEALDEQVDVAAALARARALAGSDLDAELAALHDGAAAPLAEISIEAASAELARQLGGAAVRRERSAGWAPQPKGESSPVPVPVPAASSEPVIAPAIETRLEDKPLEDQPRDDKPRDDKPRDDKPRDDKPREALSRGGAAAGARSRRRSSRDVSRELRREPTPAPVPEPIAPPVPEPTAAAAEPVAPEPADTAVGAPDFIAPDAGLRDEPGVTLDDAPREFARPVTSSREMDQLAADAAPAIAGREGSGVRRIERPDEAPPEPVAALVDGGDQRYAAPEPEVITPPSPRPALLIDDDSDLSSFERALDAARIQTGVTHTPAPPSGFEDEEDIAELDPADLEELVGDSTHIGDIPNAEDVELAARLDRHLDAAEAEADAELSDMHPPINDDFNAEEISDLDVVAEANAEDDDLLRAHGEREASGAFPVAAPALAHEPNDDFAARLDLGDDEPPPSFTDYDRNLGELPRGASRGHELASYDPTFDQQYPPGGGTFDDPHGGGAPEDFDEPHQFSPQPAAQPTYESFDEPHGFSTQTPAPRQRSRSRPEADYELENALSTLDVDLDALEIPQEQQSRPHARPLPGMPPERAVPQPAARPAQSTTQRPSRTGLKRAPTDDEGVLIDFDDDE